MTMEWKANKTGNHHSRKSRRQAVGFVTATILCLAVISGCSSKYTITSSRYKDYKGEINHHTRIIRAEPDRIFQLLTHGDTMAAICPEGTFVTYISPLPYAVGDIVETRVEHIFKLKWTARVREIIPGSLIQLEFQDGIFKGGIEFWELSPEEGGTLVSHTIIVDPKGVLRKTVWYLKARQKHDKMVELFLDNLKHLAETGDLDSA